MSDANAWGLYAEDSDWDPAERKTRDSLLDKLLSFQLVPALDPAVYPCWYARVGHQNQPLPGTSQSWGQREGSPPYPLTRTSQGYICLALRLYLRWLGDYESMRGEDEQLTLAWFAVPGSTEDGSGTAPSLPSSATLCPLAKASQTSVPGLEAEATHCIL